MSFDTVKLTIEECMDAIIDYRGKTPKKSNSGIPLITAKIVKGGTILQPTEFIPTEDYDNWMVRGLPEVSDIVLTTEAPLGEVAQLREKKVALAQRIVTLRGKKGVLDNNYLLYLLQSSNVQNQLHARATGTTVKGIKQSELRKVTLNIPPLKYQKWAAQILVALDRKIKNNEFTNQTLEKMAQALFKSWFVDFEPVKAKIAVLEAGGSQEEATLAAMTAISGKDADSLAVFEHEHPEQYAELKATAELFPSAMQESELGEIPIGWEVGKLGELIEFNPKRVLKKGSIASYLDMKNVPVSGHSAQDIIDREFSSGSKFKNGDTLLARITPCLENGKTAYVDFLPNDEAVGWGSTEFIVMRSNNNLPLSLSYFFARLDSFRTIAIQSMQGTSGRQRADASVLKNHIWVVPLKELLQKFGTFSDSILDGNRSRYAENKSLAELRDTLLPKLLSGEIPLPEAEQAVSEAENV
ncbi:restriction endonuclease subunit S [Yersinia kristensenii]|uniref:restriction endonuclease subunit S n=1 Tax=Yersinia kristensenii TaxID=28152 RepID=UPI0005DF51E0|nr:restriction endonuclease subunit S [Yersinia kristensenii]CFR19224.1 restriction modification enzyme [Yersinia kristensenii]